MQEFSIVNGCLKRYAGDDDVVTIPRGVTEIAYRAFAGGLDQNRFSGVFGL